MPVTKDDKIREENCNKNMMPTIQQTSNWSFKHFVTDSLVGNIGIFWSKIWTSFSWSATRKRAESNETLRVLADLKGQRENHTFWWKSMIFKLIGTTSLFFLSGLKIRCACWTPILIILSFSTSFLSSYLLFHDGDGKFVQQISFGCTFPRQNHNIRTKRW